MTVKVDDDAFRRRLIASIERGLGKQGALMAGHAKNKISRSQPVRRSDSGRVTGLDPSKPGEPPKQLTTNLKLSITFEVKKDAREIALYVGTNLVYARPLELGYPEGNLAPRPYLRPTLDERFDKIVQGVQRELKR